MLGKQKPRKKRPFPWSHVKTGPDSQIATGNIESDITMAKTKFGNVNVYPRAPEMVETPDLPNPFAEINVGQDIPRNNPYKYNDRPDRIDQAGFVCC